MRISAERDGDTVVVSGEFIYCAVLMDSRRERLLARPEPAVKAT